METKFLSLMPNNELVFNPTGLAARLYISDNTFQFLVTDTIEANEFLLQALCFTNSLGHFGIKLSIPQPSNYGDLSDFNSRINTFSMLQIFESILNLIQDPDHVKNGILILSIKDFAINSTLFANIINEVVIATILRVGDSLPCYQRLFTEINELIQIETSSAIKHLLEHITTNKPTVTFSDAIRYTRIAALTVIHHCWAKNPILFYRYDTSLYADRKDVNFRTKEEGLQEDLKVEKVSVKIEDLLPFIHVRKDLQRTTGKKALIFRDDAPRFRCIPTGLGLQFNPNTHYSQ
eukprot:UN10411